MGIPAFYRWLVERYPLSVVKVLEEAPKVINGVQVPVDTSSPNPNGFEFDNLYLDMNGIIHPCFHPEDKVYDLYALLPPPSSYDEVYKAVFKYIDHIFSLIRPRKLLFMAIDGVAPRAKMNQQRARRFRAAKDAADAAAEAEKLMNELEKASYRISQSEKPSTMDSNVITPGTEFMASLSLALRYYIQLRLNSDPGWRNIKVILSDANVPGEGEHKIASYIRAQRNLPGFDPNTRHCLYGLDADLIMLALATHEIHFSILREDVRVPRKNGNIGKLSVKSNFSHKRKGQLELDREENHSMLKIKFQFLHIWILRDYLEHDLRVSSASLKIDFERLIDDFVFICLFVGNDFLPHIPSLEISEGALDLLMNVYRKEFSSMGGYLTNSFEVDLARVEHFLQVVGSCESAIFRRRIQLQKERDIQFGAASSMTKIEQKNGSSWMESTQDSSNLVCRDSPSNGGSCNPMKNQMHEEVWKERYYAEKFEVKTEDDLVNLRRHTVMKYVEGICWFMHYYYQGVCSWQWFYPYHYAPFASDFLDLRQLKIQFTLGVPFKPFDQLMGVLPAASAHALPLSYRKLMTDPSSSIIGFYPPDFELDLNGKRFSWQAVCKLPFVEESHLLQEIEKVEHTLTDDEKQRNKCAFDVLFFHISHPLASKIITFYMRKRDHPKLSKVKLKKKLDAKVSAGMNGYMYISDKTVCSSEVYSPVEGMEMIRENKTIFVYYKGPPIQMHIPRVPNGATLPTKLISKKDVLPPPILWHKRSTVQRRMYSERQKIAKQESNHKNSVLGKRKRMDLQNGKRRPIKQERNHESYTNGSNLGKRKYRSHGGRGRKTRSKYKRKQH
ncbi:5'-3' exoribonuclease 4-like isoform X2 [Typha angustifolia]|uniref:5'-3' exoribonuclease 4-like isoform X2 n=1 Tax=Typha angustifolia TaxID=59011 RepID=UPI003C2EA1C2